MTNLREKLAETLMGDRAVDNWGNPLPCDYDLADAIITALPDMVVPLVWQRNGDHYAGGHGFVIRKQGQRYILTCRNKHGREFDTPEAAQAAAQAHHVATSLSAFGINPEKGLNL